jgi:tRNA (guanine37-N1)-methyltransferase
MRFHIVTLFPEFFDAPLGCGLLKRGVDKGLVSFNFVNPRDFAEDRHRSVDDRPYGGGPGMVMLPEPLLKALGSLPEEAKAEQAAKLMMSPSGGTFDQGMAKGLMEKGDIVLVCGRYEGIDERVAELFPMEPVSVGDFVLNGGEAAALCIIEAVSRLIPNFMGHEDSAEEESFSSGLLEYPHYTRPESFEGLSVPEVLRSGDHAKIAAWRHEQSLARTFAKRSDLLLKARLMKEDVQHVRGLMRSGKMPDDAPQPRRLYVALLHAPVLNKLGEKTAVSLTNLDVHDISRVSRTYDVGGFYVCTPLHDQRELLERLVGHWTGGAGGKANPDRAEALDTVRCAGDLDEVVEDVSNRTGERPFIAVTTARGTGNMTLAAVRKLLTKRAVLLVLGTGSGLAPEVFDKADGVVRPIRFLSEYNHLSVRSAAAILVDRILGDL